nr:oxygenase MpaB family protein [Nocardia tengchongensis]
MITFSLTAGSAFLLQTMEPSIAAVVDEHSTFRTDALGRAARSIASVMMWIYGGEEALTEADRLRKMHATLNSTDAHGVKHRALSSGPGPGCCTPPSSPSPKATSTSPASG